MLIVFDIDETLVHSRSEDELDSDTIKILRKSPNCFSYEDYMVIKRPYLVEALKYLSSIPIFDIAVWSAGTSDYVNYIVKKIFPDPSLLKFVMTRNDLDETWNKPLSRALGKYNEILGGTYADIHDILIVDDKPKVTAHYELNHLYVPPFEGDENDEILLELARYLGSVTHMSTAEHIVMGWDYSSTSI